MDILLMICKPVVKANIIRPDIKTCHIVQRKCVQNKCEMLPLQMAPPVSVHDKTSSYNSNDNHSSDQDAHR